MVHGNRIPERDLKAFDRERCALLALTPNYNEDQKREDAVLCFTPIS
jgi:hypothetical protein